MDTISPPGGSPLPGSALPEQDGPAPAADARSTEVPDDDVVRSADAERFRQIFIGLRLPPDGPRLIGITSAVRGEGRTTIACGLAWTLAADLDAPIMLVEADLTRPTLAAALGLPATPGLHEALRGDRTLAEVAYPLSERLSVVVAGSAAGDSDPLMRAFALRDPGHRLPDRRTIAILDLPPLIGPGYSPLAARVADVLVLVVRAGVTPVDMVRAALARLGEQEPQGVVLNAARSSLPHWWPDRG